MNKDEHGKNFLFDFCDFCVNVWKDPAIWVNTTTSTPIVYGSKEHRNVV